MKFIKHNWLVVGLVVLLGAGIVFAWTGVYDYNIDVSGILAAGYVYTPYTIMGEVYNEDIPIYSYTIEIKEGEGAYEDLETVVVAGQNIYSGAISSMGALNDEIVSAGTEYTLRIYCIDYDTNKFTEPTTWTFDVNEGYLPPEEISR
jgi:hypothetical protein